MVSSQAWWQPKVRDKCLNLSRWQGLGKAGVDHRSQTASHKKVLPDAGAESNYQPGRVGD